jgi:hypothetical protein
MTNALLGAVAMASAVAGLFFLRFWRDTRDRLFLMFGLAFWTLSFNWIGLVALSDASVESRTPFYVMRLLAFLLIVVAIADKNRAAARSRRPPPPRRDYAPTASPPPPPVGAPASPK